MRKEESGYIVVETVASFVLFVFLNISILSLINIVFVQSRVHYALTQSAEMLSMYTYALEATGVAEHFVASAGRAETVGQTSEELVSNVNGVIDALQDFSLSELRDAGGNLYHQVDHIADRVVNDPQDVLRNLLNFGLSKGQSFLLDLCMKPLMGRYLQNGSQSGEAFLETFHVEDGLDGLHFYTMDTIGYNSATKRLTSGSRNDSLLIDARENLCLVVQYDIDYTFGALPLPFGKLHVTQMAMTKAWLNGHGEGYKDAGEG